MALEGVLTFFLALYFYCLFIYKFFEKMSWGTGRPRGSCYTPFVLINYNDMSHWIKKVLMLNKSVLKSDLNVFPYNIKDIRNCKWSRFSCIRWDNEVLRFFKALSFPDLNVRKQKFNFSDVMHEKRTVEHDPAFAPLTLTAKAKTRPLGQFSLKRKKSKSQFDYDDLLCPFTASELSKLRQKWF